MPASRATEPVPLTDLAFHVLLALGDGDSHGYAIGKEIEGRSHGRLKPTTGALYQALKRLRQEGLIEASVAPEGSTDGRRRFYRLTEGGRAAASGEARRLQELVDVARDRNLLTHPS